MTSKNIGDLLNAADIPWGSFVGGFNLQTVANNGTSGCGRSSASQVTGATTADYVAHHAWFQYYASTANPTHARPNSTKSIGYTMIPGKNKVDPANHAYDIADFTAAVGSGNYPAVSSANAAGIEPFQFAVLHVRMHDANAARVTVKPRQLIEHAGMIGAVIFGLHENGAADA
jgi:hypothetical protein